MSFFAAMIIFKTNFILNKQKYSVHNFNLCVYLVITYLIYVELKTLKKFFSVSYCYEKKN